MPVITPATGETRTPISDASTQDIEKVIDAARRCFQSTWSRTCSGTRARLLLGRAKSIERYSAELAEIEVRDNGKLLRGMSAQLKSLPGWYRYYAGLADKEGAGGIPAPSSQVRMSNVLFGVRRERQPSPSDPFCSGLKFHSLSSIQPTN